MFKRIFILALCLVAVPNFAGARDKPDPLAGNWACQAHKTASGDITFTLSLTQNKDIVDGSISSSSPIGSTQISSGTIRRHMVEIHFDTPQGNYILMGK